MIGAVLVTYGDRRHTLKPVLDQIIKFSEITAIQIICNNVQYDFQDFIGQFNTDKIKYLLLPNNTGSAGGFNIGIKEIEKKKDVKYVWLLDDDTLPSANIPQLFLSNIHDDIALLPLRYDRKYLKKASEGYPVKFLFPAKNSFVGFHFLIFIQKKIFDLSGKKTKNNKRIQIPMAPYGGLFFAKSMINKIGYPNENFFLYADDFEYTYRITNAGGSIFLMADAEVEDLDKTWIYNTKSELPAMKYFNQNDYRSWLSIRNNVYFSSYHLKSNSFMFEFNKFIYMVYLGLLSIVFNKRKQFRIFKKMVNAGLNADFNNVAILNSDND